MWIWDWLVQDDTLTRKLRAFSVRHVKISEEDMTRTRKLVKDYIEDRIMEYCRQNSELPILNLQYTGSVYERLKTEAADEVDVMVVLKTSKPWFWGDPEVMKEETGFPGYVRLKATVDSKLRRYVSSEGYIIPGRLRERWFFSLVSRAVTDLRENSPGSNLDFVVPYNMGLLFNWISSAKEPGGSFCQWISFLAFKLGRMNISWQSDTLEMNDFGGGHFHWRKNNC